MFLTEKSGIERYEAFLCCGKTPKWGEKHEKINIWKRKSKNYECTVER